MSGDEKVLRIKVRLEYKDVASATFSHRRSQISIGIFIFLTIIMLIQLIILIPLVGIFNKAVILSFGYILIGTLFIILPRQRLIKRNFATCGNRDIEYTISKDAFKVIEDNNKEFEIAICDLYKVEESKTTLYVYMERRKCFLIPKRFLYFEELELFKELFKTKNNKWS